IVNFLFFLYLIFAPGSAGSNRYGQRSSPNSVILIIGALIAPLMIVGILAAVAIPAYQNYQAKARASQQGEPTIQLAPQAPN
ncbi:MAG: hypothetical protein RL748_3685, partial [Pseudomonadota bacterium]